jgi:uncharacterized RDD family membrane protein YckC
MDTTLLHRRTARERAQLPSHMERFRAPFSLRCGALLIDYILLVGIIAFSTLVARLGRHGPSTSSKAEAVGVVIAIIVAAINFVGLTALRGVSIGKWATGLCIRQSDGAPLNWKSALIRHLIIYPPAFLIVGMGLLVADMLIPAAVAGGAVVLTLGIGFVMTTLSAHGRALHDLLADTVVIREDVRRSRRVRK